MLYTNGKCVAYYMWAPPQAVSNRKHLFPKVTNLEKEKFWDWEKCWSFQFLVLTNYPWITNNIKVISGLSFWSLAVLSDLPFFPINMFSPQAILSLWRIQVWQQNKMDIRHLQQSLQLGKMVNWFSCICPYVLESIVLVFFCMLWSIINWGEGVLLFQIRPYVLQTLTGAEVRFCLVARTFISPELGIGLPCSLSQLAAVCIRGNQMCFDSPLNWNA